MILESLNIVKLFGHFDYNICFNQKDKITILTGPNGYGKTTILNIIYNLSEQNFVFFQNLNFEKISFTFDQAKMITITKNVQMQQIRSVQIIDGRQQVTEQLSNFTEIIFKLYIENIEKENYVYNRIAENHWGNGLTRLLQAQYVPQNKVLLDLATGQSIELIEACIKINRKPFSILEQFFNKDVQSIKQLVSTIGELNSYIIREQRLIKAINNNGNSTKSVIQQHAYELRNMINQKQAIAFQESQKLDSSFPKRLMQTGNKVSKEDFDSRFQLLNEKQEQLQQFGITISKTEIPEYNDNNANVLSLYLDDSEKKASVFDDLVNKINLFVTNLTKKQLAYKKIVIDGQKGFSFFDDNNQNIMLSNLSSGEQQEVVLLYELLFKTKENSLILIDEPEISLHVTWQKEFLKDLLNIAEINNISFCIATHSPQIINNYWDLTTDLYTLATKKGNPDYDR